MKKKTRSKAKAKPARKSKARKPAKSNVKVRKASSKQPSAKAVKKTKKTAKSAKPQAASSPRSGVIAPVNGVLLGYVEDYFAKIGVIALTLQGPLALGQRIQVLGHTTNLEQAVDSMQIDHAPVTQADKKNAVGIKVIGRARRGDHVYLLK
jgi:putative protease